MSVIRLIMTIAIIAVSIVMTVVILMQEGRSQGLGAISGAAEIRDWARSAARLRLTGARTRDVPWKDFLRNSPQDLSLRSLSLQSS